MTHLEGENGLKLGIQYRFVFKLTFTIEGSRSKATNGHPTSPFIPVANGVDKKLGITCILKEIKSPPNICII